MKTIGDLRRRFTRESTRIIERQQSRLDALDNAAAQMLQAIEEAHPEGGMPEWMREPYWNLREAWGKIK